MAVNIPRLQEIQPSGSPSKAGRINMNVKDGADSILNRADQLTSLANTAEKAVTKVKQINEFYEDKKGEQVSYEEENDFSTWYKQGLKEVSKITDKDPTEAYVELDKAANKKYDEMSDKRKDMSPRLRNILDRKLGKVMNLNRTKMLDQRGLQSATYETKRAKSNLKSRTNELIASVGSVKPTGESKYDTYIDGIKNNMTKQGLNTGGTTILDKDATNYDYKFKDNDGKEVKVKWTPILKARIEKQLDNGVTDSLTIALDSNEKAQAALVYDRYNKKYMSKESKAKYKKKLKSQDKSDQAYTEAAKIEGLSGQEQRDALKKIKDDKVRSKTEGLLLTSARRRHFDRKRKEDSFFKVATQEIDTMEEFNQLNGKSDVEANKKIKLIWDKLSDHQRKAIEHRIKQPKSTDPKAFNNILSIFDGTHKTIKLEDMLEDGALFQEQLAGLDTGDRGKMNTVYFNKKNLTKQEVNNQVRHGKLAKILETKLIAQGLVKYNEFKNTINSKDMVKVNRAKMDLISAMEELPSNATFKEQSEFLNKFIAKMKKNELFGSGNDYSDEQSPVDDGPGLFTSIKNVFTSDKAANKAVKEVSTTAMKKPDPFIDMDESKFTRYQNIFMAQRGVDRPKRGDEVFREFVRTIERDRGR